MVQSHLEYSATEASNLMCSSASNSQFDGKVVYSPALKVLLAMWHEAELTGIPESPKIIHWLLATQMDLFVYGCVHTDLIVWDIVAEAGHTEIKNHFINPPHFESGAPPSLRFPPHQPCPLSLRFYRRLLTDFPHTNAFSAQLPTCNNTHALNTHHQAIQCPILYLSSVVPEPRIDFPSLRNPLCLFFGRGSNIDSSVLFHAHDQHPLCPLHIAHAHYTNLNKQRTSQQPFEDERGFQSRVLKSYDTTGDDLQAATLLHDRAWGKRVRHAAAHHYFGEHSGQRCAYTSAGSGVDQGGGLVRTRWGTRSTPRHTTACGGWVTGGYGVHAYIRTFLSLPTSITLRVTSRGYAPLRNTHTLLTTMNREECVTAHRRRQDLGDLVLRNRGQTNTNTHLRRR
ncbi:hypothetical protein Hypma_014657 [Hypsizygus marmoreus]|uniref:Uncharacterized protein n=1 Tax=Hypsizygus marmoreus TaxID=39966 RepID=A0A369JII7_HYPMA|nr:hypothetical protein Hypma_014657 [Hypsizygus marmoreus]